ncbi:hypothetical protein CKO25_19055 [Thiocapsa imhoffii]|uniref:FHA domain-containing protein n=1 Tax=Thiocapsa imhoffii TaxID=382777 RepID=A0A9X1BB93_9GAMM|nr:hypothetical protein [Thiocapsa imhoffii]MBK1646698.1 hypothetical protein [Thiocapsa imhoffii]
MSHTSTWIWKDGKAPGPRTARAGETWIFHLPLMGTGPAPLIDWMDIPPGLTITPMPGDGLSFAIKIPANLVGIQTLRYRRAGEPRADELLLKILPALSSQSASTPDSASLAASPSVASAPRGPQIQGRRLDQSKDQAVSIPTPEDIRVRSGHSSDPPVSRSTESRDAQSHPPAVSSPGFVASASAPRLDPDREYEIQVYRQGERIHQLTCPLTPHKSLLVGKFSASKAVFPDIDLRNHFASSPAEALCSRQQARIYWSHGRIQLFNIGKSPITLPDGRSLPKDQAHVWTPGEEVTLPGGLSLRLAIPAY